MQLSGGLKPPVAPSTSCQVASGPGKGRDHQASGSTLGRCIPCRPALENTALAQESSRTEHLSYCRKDAFKHFGLNVEGSATAPLFELPITLPTLFCLTVDRNMQRPHKATGTCEGTWRHVRASAQRSAGAGRRQHRHPGQGAEKWGGGVQQVQPDI